MARSNIECKVYVGELGENGNQTELEDAFAYYGPVKSVWVARQPPGFAFVEFEDPRDARDAVRGLDGRTVCGRRVTVEMSSGKSRNGPRGGGRPGDSSGCYECGEKGHFARDCDRKRGGGGGGYRRRSPSPARNKGGRSRSRSYSPRRNESR